MLRLGSAQWNAMAVDIEDVAFDAQTRHAGFLLRLAQGHACQVGIAIGMAAGLQPAIEFAVMHQQYPFAVAADQPCRAGEVRHGVAPIEDIGVALQEILELRDGFFLPLP